MKFMSIARQRVGTGGVEFVSSEVERCVEGDCDYLRRK